MTWTPPLKRKPLRQQHGEALTKGRGTYGVPYTTPQRVNSSMVLSHFLNLVLNLYANLGFTAGRCHFFACCNTLRWHPDIKSIPTLVLSWRRLKKRCLVDAFPLLVAPPTVYPSNQLRGMWWWYTCQAFYWCRSFGTMALKVTMSCLMRGHVFK